MLARTRTMSTDFSDLDLDFGDAALATRRRGRRDFDAWSGVFLARSSIPLSRRNTASARLGSTTGALLRARQMPEGSLSDLRSSSSLRM